MVACVMVGITPACAGNRSASIDSLFVATDHPRVCGEQPFRAAIMTA